MFSKYDYHHIQFNHYIINKNYHQHWSDDKIIKFSIMIIIIFNLFIMIHNHNKIIINVGQMIKLQWLKQTENYDSRILNRCWTDIELILNKTYEHDKLIMITLPPMLVER
jgi:hypothetical protein